jgi:hypothetical protein
MKVLCKRIFCDCCEVGGKLREHDSLELKQ